MGALDRIIDVSERTLEVDAALQYISPDEYDEWTTIGMAIQATLGDGGFELWDRWSSRSAKYSGVDALREKWLSFKPNGGIGPGTLFKAAQERGWKQPARKRIDHGANPDGAKVANSIGAKPTDDAETGAPLPMPSIYSAADMAKRPAVEREWIVDQWLPARSNVVVGGHGGSGKSMLMAMLAVCVNTGVPFYGLPIRRTGPAIIYACEDDVDEWKFRLQSAAAYRNLDFASLTTHVVDALETERDPALFAPPATDPRADAGITQVGLYLAAQVQAIQPALIVIDAAADAFGGDEIRRREVRRYLRTMRHELATPSSACLVHILHVDKLAARGKTTTDLYSGSTDWNNGVRARLAFYRPQAEDAQEDGPTEADAGADLRLEVQKANYAKRGAFVDLRYDEAAHVFVQVGGSTASSGDVVSSIRQRNDERVILRALAAAEDADDPVFSGERCNRNAAVRLKAAEALPQPFRGRAGRGRLFSLLLRLKADGLLAEDAIRTAARHKVQVWRVTAAGRIEINDATPALA